MQDNTLHFMSLLRRNDKYTPPCFVQFKVYQTPANVPDLGLLNAV